MSGAVPQTALPFTKMEAQGNDFVILDGLDRPLPSIDEAFVRTITERRYGIGCDQLLILTPSDQADAQMAIYNNDGSEAGNCGNGLRCVADLLMRKSDRNEASIALRDRIVHAERSENGIRVEMGSATISHACASHIEVEIGNPHSVFFEAVDQFPHDRNIEIITGQVADHIYIDIIERGAGRTRACGSGACATAVAIWHAEQHTRPLTIEMPGGCVTVCGNPQEILLDGVVHQTFSGHYTIRKPLQKLQQST